MRHPLQVRYDKSFCVHQIKSAMFQLPIGGPISIDGPQSVARSFGRLFTRPFVNFEMLSWSKLFLYFFIFSAAADTFLFYRPWMVCKPAFIEGFGRLTVDEVMNTMCLRNPLFIARRLSYLVRGTSKFDQSVTEIFPTFMRVHLPNYRCNTRENVCIVMIFSTNGT